MSTLQDVRGARGMRRERLDVLVLAGGGLAHTSGGVGTLMQYLMEHWQVTAAPLRVRVLDTRGQGGVAGGLACFLRAALVLAWRCLTGGVSLVHAHMTTRGSAFRKSLLCGLAASFGRPSILHMHGADFMPFYTALPRYQRWPIRQALRRARRVVVLGEAWRPFLVDVVGVEAARIAVVMNGVPAPASVPDRSVRLPGPVRLLFLGRLGARKGVPELLAALSMPALRDLPWVATLAGDGEVAEFRDAVAQAGLAERVAVPGWVGREETGRLLRAADILVLPSYHEAMPMAVIEALAHQVAVVTTPVGVIPEILRDGTEALLVPPGDPVLLAEALARLIDDAPLRASLAASGHRSFLARLDIAAVAQRMLELYRDTAMSDGPGGTGGRSSAIQSLIDRILHVERPDQAAALVQRLTRAERPIVVSFINQHALNMAWREPSFAALLAGAEVLLRDGLGLAACLRALGRAPGLNMNGTDFIPVLAAAFAGRRVAVFGTCQPWLGAAAAALDAKGCTMVAVLDGFQPEGSYVAAAIEHAPDLLLLAMGMPKQERVAAAIAAAVGVPMVIVNGGAVVDFMAGRFRRAPAWTRRCGLEWAFRLIQEPRRLWRRYLSGGVVFGLRVLRLRSAVRRQLLPEQLLEQTLMEQMMPEPSLHDPSLQAVP